MAYRLARSISSKTFFAALMLASSAFAEDAPYLQQNSVSAHRRILVEVQKDPKNMKTDETAAWVKAVLAGIALDRLSGDEAEALSFMRRCVGICEELAPVVEWKSLKTWACETKKETKFCPPENIQAQ